MKRLRQGRGSALKAMVPLHCPFHHIWVAFFPSFHVEKHSQKGGWSGKRKEVVKEILLAIDRHIGFCCALSASTHMLFSMYMIPILFKVHVKN